MKSSLRYFVSIFAVAAFTVGVGALLLAPKASAGNCWKVDCNTCCQVGGKVICTQRLCS
jgi:hypothetical protein